MGPVQTLLVSGLPCLHEEMFKALIDHVYVRRLGRQQFSLPHAKVAYLSKSPKEF